MKKHLVTAIVLTCMATLPYTASAQDLADNQIKTYAQNSLNEADYTPEQWQQIQESINALQKTSPDIEAPKIFNEVISASEEFTSDSQENSDTVYHAHSLNETDYTPEQWQQIQESIKKCKEPVKILNEEQIPMKENPPVTEFVNTITEPPDKSENTKFAVAEDTSKSSAKQNTEVSFQDDNDKKTISELITESQQLRNELNQYLKAENKAKLNKKALSKKTVLSSPTPNNVSGKPANIQPTTEKTPGAHLRAKFSPAHSKVISHNEDELSNHRTGAAVLKRTRHEKRPIEVADPSDLNFSYTTKGKKYCPKYIWDDSHYTFLLFPQAVYKQDIYILACTNDNVQQLREYEIQDEFMKLPGTWSKLKFFIGKHSLMIENENFIQ